MTYLNFDEAVKKVMKEKEEDGAHVFYFGDKGVFEVRGDTKNGAYANAKITTHFDDYFGWIKDYSSKSRWCETWTLNNVVDELMCAIEYQRVNYKGVMANANPHNFSLEVDSKIYADVQRIAYLGHKDVDN
jgi:hypothetical protein